MDVREKLHKRESSLFFSQAEASYSIWEIQFQRGGLGLEKIE